MFEEIDKNKIKIRDGIKNTLTYAPNIISMGPLDDLLKATEWLYSEAMEDYTATNKKVEESREKHGYSQKNIDEMDDLAIRLGSRMQGYVNQLCLMEDILVYEYDRMAELVKTASGGKITFNPKKDYEDLRKRFSSIRTFRNKVVAHTAYTYPKIDKKTGISEDNPETIVRSILNLFPEPCGITLGGSFFSGFSQYRSQLPIITIFNWEKEIRPIFEDWKKLFMDRLLDIHSQCPFNNANYTIEIGSYNLAIRSKTKRKP